MKINRLTIYLTIAISLLITKPLFSQQSTLPGEKVHLHLNKPYYLIGDTVWFKAYTVLKGSNELSALSKVLHVELLTLSGRRVTKLQLPIRAGLANGDIALSDTLKQGQYILRAYTNWMRNDGETTFFKKQIQLVSDFSSEEITTQKTITGTLPDVQFFPEGGDLVAGLRSRVGIKVVGPDGRGLSAEGQVTDANNEVVAQFKTAYAGIGSFVFTPETGKKYSASVRSADNSVQQRLLPSAKGTGYVLSVNNTETDTIFMSISQSKGILLTELLLTASNNVDEYFSARIMPRSNKVVVAIPRKQLPAGVVRITLYTKEKEPLAERLSFNKRSDALKLKLNIVETSKSVPDSTTIEFQALDEANSPVIGSFSLAIVKAKEVPYQQENELSIRANLLFTSELKGNIEHPNYYFLAQSRTDSIDRAKHLDNLLITQGWRRLLKASKLNYPVEKSLKISGRLLNNKDEPITSSKVRLFATTSGGPLLIDTITNSEGRFEFNDLDFYGTLKYMIQVPDIKDKHNIKILIDNLDNTAPSLFQILAVDTLKNLKQQISTEKFKQVVEKRRAKQGIILKEVAINAEKPIYSSSGGLRKLADKIIGPERLKNIGSLVEAIEYSGAFIKWNRDGNAEYTGIRAVQAKLNGFDIVIDGKNFSDNDLVRTIDPNTVESVEIFLNGSSLGVGDRGAIVINTKMKNPYRNLSAIKVAGVDTFTATGYSEAREFYVPRYHSKQLEPDLSDAVYWKPYVTPDESGRAFLKFYQSNKTEQIRVTVEGITADGKMGSAVYNHLIKE